MESNDDEQKVGSFLFTDAGRKPMVIALHGLLGVPLWLLLGWVAAGNWRRQDLKSNLPGLFKMKVRVVEGTYRHIDEKFSRTDALAIWAHDVLILEKGLLVARNLHFAVADGVQVRQSLAYRSEC